MSERETTGTAVQIDQPIDRGLMIPITAETVKRYINPLATDQEIALFLNQCVMFELNPFKRQIYLVKYKSTEPATFIIGYEVYLKRAERTKKWSGMESGITQDPGGKIISAWVKVYRKDWDQPLHHEVYFEEYVQTKAEWVDGKPTGKKVPTRFWADKPRTMLKKVAICQAFRMAFPDEMAGMPFAAEELAIDHAKLASGHVVIDAEYEASKREPLRDIKDEFTDPPAIEKPAAKPLEPDPVEQKEPEQDGDPEIPSMKQMERFAKFKVDLAALGIDEAKMLVGIQRFADKTFNLVVGEMNDFTPEQFELVLGYLARWKGAKEADQKKAQDGKK